MKLTQAFGRMAVIAMAASVTGFAAVAQEAKIAAKDVPAPVIAAFKAAYPKAIIKGYAQEKENGKTFYEIESKDGDTGRDVLYHSDGQIAEIEETIAASDLPAAAQAVVRTKFPGGVVTKAEKTTEKSAQGDKVGYEVIVRQGKKRSTLEFDVDGTLKSKAH